ncbi:hypothetical protein K3718_07745 [Leisingera aquaemixtae]|uniref:Uncharacterized protein n=1 Tax=Leisingera aquaemixtae TaxID=1396826 RepID=A0ABY5WN76_9RHOB|nr:hypothetical protein [Leisingera aquaemixtae]UWQ42969.1 hypothetical protein K3718_07745 [Leisingera aquaemixtae]
MLTLFKLLLPALMPSWRFFKSVDPSPRVEWRLLASPSAAPAPWQEFRPRPQRLSPQAVAGRMLWNARWNESLFLVSCAERLTLAPTEHSLREILRRIAAELQRAQPPGALQPYLQFRLVFLDRGEDGQLIKAVTYQSEPYLMAALSAQAARAERAAA